MSYSINQIDGLEEDEVQALKALGLRTTERLLEATKTPKGRRDLAEKTCIDQKRPARLRQCLRLHADQRHGQRLPGTVA